MAKNYNRVMLGPSGMYADICRKDGFVGVDFLSTHDLSNFLTESRKDFNNKFVPIWMEEHPEKSKTAAGPSCGFLWTVCKGLQQGDVVLTPNGRGEYYIGQIDSDYYYVKGEKLPHRRRVKWLEKTIARSDMSDKLRHSTGSIGTCCDVTKHAVEIESLISQCGASIKPIVNEPVINTVKSYNERSLHPLFCTALRNEGIIAKTIFHEKSTTKDSGQKWVHPDIVGVEIERFEQTETLAILKATEPSETVKIYSFELKKSINSDYELKQCYFQALSNSSWANYGYLVAFDISEDIREEMERLNNAFGIGIIRMGAKEYDVLFPARERSLDYNTIEKLNKVNPDFRMFISKVASIITAEKQYAEGAKLSLEKICDDIIESEEEIEAYCKANIIPY